MNIIVVFGGKSVEHDVSIITAKQIYGMIDTKKYRAILVYADRDGNLLEYTNANFDLADFKSSGAKQSNAKFCPVAFYNGSMLQKGMLGYGRPTKIDAAIICCHGGDGENGTLESYLLSCKIPVTAGSSLALGVSMDKWQTKQMLLALGLPVIKGFCITNKMTEKEIDNQIRQQIDYPVILKPCGGGSSIGIEVVDCPQKLHDALQVAFEFDSKVVIEKAIADFDEYNCAVLGENDNYIVSKIDKPIKYGEILSFEDKYMKGGKNFRGKKSGVLMPKNGSIKNMVNKSSLQNSPAKIDKKLEAKIQKYSSIIFERLGYFGVIRIDYIMDKLSKKLYVNEINAVPGSLANYFFVGGNFSGCKFVDRLIDIAIKEYAKMQKLNKNYITKLL